MKAKYQMVLIAIGILAVILLTIGIVTAHSTERSQKSAEFDMIEMMNMHNGNAMHDTKGMENMMMVHMKDLDEKELGEMIEHCQEMMEV